MAGSDLHDDRNDESDNEWLTFDEAAARLGVSRGRIRQLIQDRALLAVRRDGKPVIYAGLIRDGQPLRHLRGTAIVLFDAGFDDDETMNWLLADNPALGRSPLDALLAGRRAEVRRVAQALAF